jgi:8-oxo-dGTP pyrophosphatase MutT (NUDIX family)
MEKTKSFLVALLSAILGIIPTETYAKVSATTKAHVAGKIAPLYAQNANNKKLKVVTLSLLADIQNETNALNSGNAKALNLTLKSLTEQDFTGVLAVLKSALKQYPNQDELLAIQESVQSTYDFLDFSNDPSQGIDPTTCVPKPNQVNAVVAQPKPVKQPPAPKPTKIKEVHIAKNSPDIAGVGTHVKQLLAQGYNSDEILVVFDIDGTLTNYSEPSNNPGPNFPPRKNAVKLVQDLHQQGIPLIASSAYHQFNASIKKLEDLGLTQEFGVKQSSKAHYPKLNLTKENQYTGNSFGFDYYKEGNVVSVSHSGNNYYIKKALSPGIALDAAAQKKIKRVIFVDDNPKYIQEFSKDLKTFRPLGPNVEQVDYFNLTAVNGSAHAAAPALHGGAPAPQGHIAGPAFDPSQKGKGGGGAIAYAKPNGNSTYVLLGKERGGPDAGTWCIPLGSVDRGETFYEGAAREFHEETAGLYSNNPNRLKGLKYALSRTMDFNDPTKVYSQTVAFALPVPFIPARNFTRSANMHPNRHYREMSDYMWVKVDDIEQAIIQGKNEFNAKSPSGHFNRIKLRPIARKLFKEAHQSGLLQSIK